MRKSFVSKVRFKEKNVRAPAALQFTKPCILQQHGITIRKEHQTYFAVVVRCAPPPTQLNLKTPLLSRRGKIRLRERREVDSNAVLAYWRGASSSTKTRSSNSFLSPKSWLTHTRVQRFPRSVCFIRFWFGLEIRRQDNKKAFFFNIEQFLSYLTF